MPRAKAIHDHPVLIGMPEVRRLWHNDELFSEHYVKARLAKNDWWPSDDDVRPDWEFCRDLYNKRYLALAKNNEAFTRQELVDRVLEKLGFAWTDNLGLPDEDAEPDYILFTSQAEKEAVLEKDTASRYRASAAILEAKKLNHPLSQVSKHQQRYPHQQIRDYLQDARVLAWGILTNGNEWRLYGRDARRQDFFAINFEVAIQSLENFKVFLAFFSPAALQRDAQGKCRLDFIREQSLSAQSQLEEDLRQRVYTILTNLANGFATRPENQIPDTADGHKALYESCLIYLYRLLFLLYAEGRGLLPVEPRTRRYYKELSLERLKPDLKNFAAYDSHTRTRLGEDISELFGLVNGTDEAKNKEYSVARYNGGLFDPAQHPLLENWRIADADLASVLRGLMFDPPPKPNEPALPIHTVDFGDLRVQQLGSIYEGLLEYHFVRPADGRLALQTDKAERKATGTYYTPDYIVKYIVEQTLLPLLDEIERSQAVRAACDAKRQDNSFADAVLALNVCDPAMGSGHFLVEATTVLADHIAAHPTTLRLHEKSKDEEELAYWRRRVVEACIYGVDLNPLAVELAKLSLWLTCIASDQPLNFLDHHLRCGNSLIGARLDQLGSLPEKKAKRGAAAKQIGFTFGPDFKRAVAETIGVIRAIELEASGDVKKVKDKERRWAAEILPRLAPYKRVADLWTGTFFGEELDEETYVDKAREILKPPARAKTGRPARAQARRTEDSPLFQPHPRRFFHWELEFPDVFFAADGSPRPNPGFDAVIGNPPWEKISAASMDKIFLDVAFADIREGEINFYNLFIHRSHFLTGGSFLAGLLVPNTWLINKYGALLRQFVLTHFHTEEIFYLCKNVFPDAPDTIPVMLVSRKLRVPRTPPATQRTRVKVVNDEKLGQPDFLKSLVWEDEGAEDLWFQREFHQMSVFDTERNREFCDALESVSEPLGVLAHASDGIYKSTVEEHRLASRQAPTDKPVIESADQVSRYSVEWAGSFIPKELWKEHEALHKGDKIALHAARKPKLERRLVAGLTGQDLYFSNRFILVKLSSERHSANFILSLLNSSVLNRYFKLRFPITDVDGYMLHQLPIRRISFTTPATKRAALLAKAEPLYERGEAESLLAFVGDQMRAKPELLDVVHDLLAFLAGRMMHLNLRQRTAACQFLTDLRDFHGIDGRALTPKTKLDEFWKLETAELFAHLGKNRKALAAAKLDLNEAAENKIRSRFEQARAAILPLESQIAFTDELIDQIVYRLYGLTEDEILVVKQGGPK